MKKFKGTGVAIVTPFKNDSSIDFAALGRVVNHVINGGVNYIVVMGTTGESATLTKDEKKAIISYVVEELDNRVPLVIGIGGNSTQEVINSASGIRILLELMEYYQLHLTIINQTREDFFSISKLLQHAVLFRNNV